MSHSLSSVQATHSDRADVVVTSFVFSSACEEANEAVCSAALSEPVLFLTMNEMYGRFVVASI
jgi:uncharacterized protein (DUF1778 family)